MKFPSALVTAVLISFLAPLTKLKGQSFYPYSDGKKWGFVDGNHRVTIPAEFDSVLFPHNRNDLLVVIQNKKQALFTKAGKQLSPFAVDWIDYSMSSNLDYIDFTVNGKYGFMDSTGKVICKPRYDRVYSFEGNGLCRVMLNNKWGLMNRSGREVTKPIYDEVHFFNEDGTSTYAKLDGKYCHLDATGKQLYKPTYDDLSWLEGKKDKYAIARLNGHYGLIDGKGKAASPFDLTEMQFIELAKDGIAVFSATRMGKTIYLKGTQVLDHWAATPENNTYVTIEEPAVAGATRSGKQLAFAKTGNGFTVTDKETRSGFQVAGDFDSLTTISKNYFYKKGELVLKCWKNGKVGLINESGKMLTPVDNNAIEPLWQYTHLLVCTRDGRKAIESIAYTLYKTGYDYTKFVCCVGGDSYSAQYILATRVDGYRGYLTTDGKSYFPLPK